MIIIIKKGERPFSLFVSFSFLNVLCNSFFLYVSFSLVFTLFLSYCNFNFLVSPTPFPFPVPSFLLPHLSLQLFLSPFSSTIPSQSSSCSFFPFISFFSLTFSLFLFFVFEDLFPFPLFLLFIVHCNSFYLLFSLGVQFFLCYCNLNLIVSPSLFPFPFSSLLPPLLSLCLFISFFSFYRFQSVIVFCFCHFFFFFSYPFSFHFYFQIIFLLTACFCFINLLFFISVNSFVFLFNYLHFLHSTFPPHLF